MASTAPASTRPSVVVAGAGRVVESFHRAEIVAEAPSVSIFEAVVSPGQEPPMHLHANEDEVFYVLDGQITVWVDGAEHRASAGSCAVLPADVPHTFAVDTETARMLVVCAPGGFEGMFAEIPAPVDMAVAQAAFDRYGVTVTGPNPRYA